MKMTHPTWTYQGRIYNELSDFPEGTYGFIYEVKHIPTGKKYIGKKVLFFERNKNLGKKALEELKAERKEKGIGGRVPLKQKVVIESDWKSYYGSHKEILELVKEGKQEEFERRILHFVTSKKLLTYYETAYLFKRDVLTNYEYLNDNILGKFYRKDFDGYIQNNEP